MVCSSNYANYHHTDVQLKKFEPLIAPTSCVSPNTSTHFNSSYVQAAYPIIMHLKTTPSENISKDVTFSSTQVLVTPPITSAVFFPTIDVHKEISIENRHYRKDKIYKDSIYYRCKNKECKGRIVLNKGIYTLTIPHACNNKVYDEPNNSVSKNCIYKKKPIRIYCHDEYKYKERYHFKDSHYLVCATKKCSARAILKDGIITAKQNHTEDCVAQIKRGVIAPRSKSREKKVKTREKSSKEKGLAEELSLYTEPLNKLMAAKLLTDLDTTSPSEYTLNNQKNSPKISTPTGSSKGTPLNATKNGPIYVMSKRGTRMIYFDRFLYVKYKEHRNKTYFRCHDIKCRVRGSVMNHMFQCDTGHDHPDHQNIVSTLKQNPIKLISNEIMENEFDGLAMLQSAAQSLEDCGEELLTQKNKVLLYKDKFLYLVNRTVSDKVYYKCKRPSCPSRAVKKDGILTVTIAHNHPDDIKAYHNFVFVSTLKEIISQNPQLSKQELYYRELAKLDANIAGYIKPYISICRTLQRASSTNQHTTLKHNLYCHHPYTTTTLTQNPLF